MSEEWGPWIEHDGKGCPIKGAIAQVEYADGDVVLRMVDGKTFWRGNRAAGFSGPTYVSSWDWSSPGRAVPAIRYRIRKPRGLTILENIIADLPAPVAPKVDA
jgi:hypothetical protein